MYPPPSSLLLCGWRGVSELDRLVALNSGATTSVPMVFTHSGWRVHLFTKAVPMVCWFAWSKRTWGQTLYSHTRPSGRPPSAQPALEQTAMFAHAAYWWYTSGVETMLRAGGGKRVGGSGVPLGRQTAAPPLPRWTGSGLGASGVPISRRIAPTTC